MASAVYFCHFSRSVYLPTAPFSEWPFALEKLPGAPLLCLVLMPCIHLVTKDKWWWGVCFDPFNQLFSLEWPVVYKSKTKLPLEYDENYAGGRIGS